jgi:hypothetical protein
VSAATAMAVRLRTFKFIGVLPKCFGQPVTYLLAIAQHNETVQETCGGGDIKLASGGGTKP